MNIIEEFLINKGAFITKGHSPFVTYYFSGKRKIDVYINILDEKIIIDIQYLPLEECVYEGKIESITEFLEIISTTKLNYIIGDLLLN